MAERADGVCLRWGALTPTLPLLYAPEQLYACYEQTIANGCFVEDEVWQKLQYFAHKTYVPSSCESRISGAGAGLLDND